MILSQEEEGWEEQAERISQSFQLTKKVQEGFVELLRLIKVTGMASFRQHDNFGGGDLLKALKRLSAQTCVTLSIDDQSWGLERSKY